MSNDEEKAKIHDDNYEEKIKFSDNLENFEKKKVDNASEFNGVNEYKNLNKILDKNSNENSNENINKTLNEKTNSTKTISETSDQNLNQNVNKINLNQIESSNKNSSDSSHNDSIHNQNDDQSDSQHSNLASATSTLTSHPQFSDTQADPTISPTTQLSTLQTTQLSAPTQQSPSSLATTPHPLTSTSQPLASTSVTTSSSPKQIPSNIIIEQALLGALLLNNEIYENIADILLPIHFFSDLHKKIYTTVKYFIDKGSQIDPITLSNYFEKDTDFISVGGTKYLFDLVESVISISGTEEYAKIIYDLYIRRQLIIIGDEIVNKSYQVGKIDTNAIDIVRSAEENLYQVAEEGIYNRGLVTFNNCLDSAIASAEYAYNTDSNISGITSGFTDIDNFMGGLNPSDLIIVAGRPSMGKTAFATNIAFNAAFAESQNKHGGAKVAFFSLEMSDEQLTTRILASVCEIAAHKIKRGEITADEFKKFKQIGQDLKNLNLFIDDTPGISVPILRSRARKLKRTKGLDLIIIDYLQLLQSSSNKYGENRVQEISDITRSLKVIAKELNVPIIALSQLSRAVENRDDKRPQLADLRESGSIEQDADVVAFVYREEYYLSRVVPETGTQKYNEWLQKYAQVQNTAEIILAKQRHGPIGTIKLFFDGRYTKFSNLAKY